jgi:hypothetical protein
MKEKKSNLGKNNTQVQVIKEEPKQTIASYRS